MKKFRIFLFLSGSLFTTSLFAQKHLAVPHAVKNAFAQKYPEARQVNWETEKGNFEANWGGKSGEDNSALFTPAGQFMEIAKAIKIKELPSSVLAYVKEHYKKSSISEAAIVTDAKGKISYEAEVNHRDIKFDEHGNFQRTEKE
ncbi:MAG: PepSY-like domain-containing protein [Flavisolibacter sp.]